MRHETFFICLWTALSNEYDQALLQLCKTQPINLMFGFLKHIFHHRNYWRDTKGMDSGMESTKQTTHTPSGRWKVSASGILTGTNPSPRTFAAERSFSLSPCPPLRLIPPSWSDPAAWSSPSSPSLASLWWGEGKDKEKREKVRKNHWCAQCTLQFFNLSYQLFL